MKLVRNICNLTSLPSSLTTDNFSDDKKLRQDGFGAVYMDKTHPGSTNLETIFSPILEPNDLVEKQAFCNSITSNFGSPVFALEDNHVSKSLCDYQTCSISEFYISDMIIAGIPSDGVAVDDSDITNSISFDYRCDESGLLFDVGDQCMLIPFLDCTLVTSDSEDAMSHEDDTSFYLAISQMSSCNAESYSNSESDDAESFDPRSYIKSLPKLSYAVSSGQSSEMPKGIQKKKSVTLVLDLDVANVVLWRKKNVAMRILLVIPSVWVVFEISGYTVVSSLQCFALTIHHSVFLGEISITS